MHMSRRALLRSLGAVAATAMCGGTLGAANRAGLESGSFVWQPRLAPAGPLLITYSAADELVRIFRGGVEIGISTCRVRSPRHSSGWSVFSVGGEPSGMPLAWSGTPVYAAATNGKALATPLVELPPDLSRLLAEAISGPSVVVLASAEVRAGIVTGAGLLPAGASLIETQALDGMSGGAPHASAERYSATTLVVSSADRKAYLCRPGQPEISGNIQLEDPGRPLGDRLYRLVELGPTAERTRWLGFDLTPQRAPHTEALGRVSLAGGPLTPYVVASALGADSTLLMTDGPAPPLTRRSGRPHTLLSSPGAAPPRTRRGAVRPQRPQWAELGGTIRPFSFFKDY